MPVTTNPANVTAYSRKGDQLNELNFKTVGVQVKLTSQNGVTQGDVQAELEAVHTKIDELLTSANAMQYKGTVNADGDLPTTYEPGWTWIVGTKGTYKNYVCEVGDMIIASTSRAGSGNTDADFNVIQTNIPNPMSGPASSTVDNLVLFGNATGTEAKDSGISLTTLNDTIALKDVKWSMAAATLPDAVPGGLPEGGTLFVGIPD